MLFPVEFPVDSLIDGGAESRVDFTTVDEDWPVFSGKKMVRWLGVPG